jgi:hypothetical protein
MQRTTIPTSDETTLLRSAITSETMERDRQILDDYLAAIERGASITPERLLARHPADAEKLQKLWQVILIRLRVWRIASVAMRESWDKERIKTAGLPASRAFKYIERHTAAVVHKRVALLLRRDPSIDGGAATFMIVRASERLNRQLLRSVCKGTRAKLRAA